MGTEEPLPLTETEMLAARSVIQQTHIHLSGSFDVTSYADEDYNCVAWAAGDTEKNWWPLEGWWPPTVERKTSIDSFIRVFHELGYAVCEDGSLEVDFEKVVLFTRDGRPTHMARQFNSGRWTSKSGALYDIALTDLTELSGGKTGKVELYMKRKRT